MRFKKKWIFLLVCLLTLLTLYAAHPLYLSVLGHLMVVSDQLEKSDTIVVLDGDYPQDERLLHALQLWKEGLRKRMERQ